MAQSKFGLQIHSHGLAQEATSKLHDSMDALNPTVSLVLDNVAYARMLKSRHPDTEIILRLWPDDEPHKHKDGRPPITPAQHADRYVPYADDGFICHGMNEPQWVANNQLDPAAIQWSIEFGRECVKRGLRAVLWNTGAGKVNEHNVHALRPLIELVNQYPGQLYLGLHEYTNYDYMQMYPWLFGSFKFIHDYCDNNGLARPQIIFTEWGYDTRHNHPAGKQWNLAEAIAYGGGADNAAQNLINAYNQIYAGHDNIIGFCYFSYGSASDKWHPYDIIRNGYPAFLDYIVSNWPRESGQLPPPPPIPEPPPDPDDTQPTPPDPDPPGTLCAALRWILQRFCGDC